MNREKAMFTRMLLAGFALATFTSGIAWSDDSAPTDRSIAYAIYDIQWSLYQTKETKDECPSGLAQLGPREQFKAKFSGVNQKLTDTQLVYESDIWFPSEQSDQFPFREAGGKIAIGLDLDGKTKLSDFTSPDGQPGIDNQLFRVIGCIGNFRDGSAILEADKHSLTNRGADQIVVELTDVDSLVNDDDVTITTYHGRDPLVRDATGATFQAGGTQRLDLRWGKNYIQQAKAKIVGGMLITTAPMKDFFMPHEGIAEAAADEWMRDARFSLKLTPAKAEGLIAGYADVEAWYRARTRMWSTHHLSYGQQAQGSIYRELRKLADGFPDAQTGANTAISASYSVKMIQVRVIRPPKDVAEKDSGHAYPQFANSVGAGKSSGP